MDEQGAGPARAMSVELPPTQGMTSPDEITVLEPLSRCMLSCLGPSHGYALSKCK